MKEEVFKKKRQARRRLRSRKKILVLAKKSGMPRLSVFRSNKYFYAQIIDDIKGVTMVAATEKEIEAKGKTKGEKALLLGEKLAWKAASVGIKKVVFDRGSYKYHGRVKNFAEAARRGGLIF